MPIDLTGVAAATGLDAVSGPAAKPALRSVPQSVPRDTTSISPQAKTLSVPALTSQALASASARATRVEALRLAVANAAYSIDPSLIAEAILSSSV